MTKWTSEFLTRKFGSKMVRVAFAPYGEYDLQFLGLQVS